MQFSAILTPFALAAVLWGTVAPLTFAQGRDNVRADDAILEMAQAYKQRDRRKLSALMPQVRGSILEPWGAYWELSVRLDEANTAEIQDYMARFSGTYQEDKLRTEWLLQLGRNRDWGAFNREYPKYRMQDDKSVRCYALLADHLSSGANINAAVTDIWLSLKDADEGCAAAADQLIKDHSMQTHTVWLRARLGMENDRPRIATQAVGLLNDKWSQTVSTIYQNPLRYLNDKVTALRPQTREFVALALIRLAWIDHEQAATEIDKFRWKTQLTQEERSWIWGVIGKRSAQRLSDDAVGYFSQGQFSQMHEDHLAWAARAALRAGRWRMVQEIIAAMPETLRKESTWVYWNARAALNQPPSEGARAAALAQLESIASVRGFYEQLALEELGQRIRTPERPEPLTHEEREAARQNPGLARALYAIQIGLRSEGVREWNYSTNLHNRGGMDDRNLLAAADLACRAEVWDRCINSSEKTRAVFDVDQRYPMPFRNAVIARGRQIGLDPAYVYGLIRQESRFVMDAKSTVGASGLMQVMPATAKWTAKKMGMTDFHPSQITDRDTNIAIGTGYLKLLLDNFGGSMPMATAAYNAGPNRPRNWRGQTGGPILEAAIWAENIPFNETRDYVKKVLANTTNYAALITGQPQSLKARLGTVGPRDATTPDPSADIP